MKELNQKFTLYLVETLTDKEHEEFMKADRNELKKEYEKKIKDLLDNK